MRWKSHVRFGRRPGETEQGKPCHRAPSRPHLATQAVDEVRRRVHATPTRGQARHRHQLLNLLITDAKDCEVLFTLTVQSRSRGEISPAHDGSVSNLQGWVASRGAARNPAAR